MDTKSNKRPREDPVANKKRLVSKTIIYDESKPNQWLDDPPLEIWDHVIIPMLVKKKKAWAQCYLGSQYLHGRCFKKDVKRAFVLYKLAADQGDAVAQYDLGYMYQDGIGTKPDVKRAIELYTLSGSGANWKLADQLYELANFYHIRDHKPDDKDDFIQPAARDMYMQARIVSNIPLIKSIDSEWMNGLNTKNVLEYFQHGVVLDLLQFRLRQDHKSIATATVKKE